MTTSGVNITKANITASMEALKSFNSGIVWHSGNQPFQNNITGGDTTGYATQSFAAEISDANVTASTIVNNFRGYSNLLSRIRSVRLQKWFQIQGDGRAQLDYDYTAITNLNANYAANIVGTNVPASDSVVSASDLDAFVASLSTAINNHRTSTVLIEEFYCHSNCHGSCHGSL
jgi:hypothetical protein